MTLSPRLKEISGHLANVIASVIVVGLLAHFFYDAEGVTRTFVTAAGSAAMLSGFVALWRLLRCALLRGERRAE